MNTITPFKFALSTAGSVLCAIFIDGFLSYLFFSMQSTTLGALITLVPSVVLYLMFLYIPSWHQGDKDRNKVQFGHEQMDLFKGLKGGLIACVPFLLLGLFPVLSKLGVIGTVLPFYKIYNAPFLGLVTILMPQTFIEQVSWGALCVFLLLPLLIPLVAGIAYPLGYKQISLKNKIVFQTPEDGQK